MSDAELPCLPPCLLPRVLPLQLPPLCCHVYCPMHFTPLPVQYTQRVRQELEGMRRQCNALLLERFGLEQCIR